jgi:hypothetical protein
MTSFKRGLLLALTIASIAAGAVMLWFAFAGGLARATGVPTSFLVSVVVNGIALLCYIRLIQTSRDLSPEQKNMWTIGVFVGLGIGQVIYFARHIHPTQR